MKPSEAKTGGCQCGAVRYRLRALAKMLYVCHCSDCQKQSSSAFGMSLIMAPADVEFVRGRERLRSWDTRGDDGRLKRCWFCPDCGNRIYHENPKAPDIVRLKPGTLDDPSVLQPQVRGWMCRQQPWLEHYSELPVVDRQIDHLKAIADVEQGKQPFQ